MTMVHRSVTFLIVSLTLGCAASNTATRPAHIPPPVIAAELVNDVFFGSGRSAPATIEVRIENTAAEPITVTRIDVDSSGMAQWGLLSQSRPFREVIEPHSTRAINFFATAHTETSRRTEPLSFNVRVEFEAAGKRWQQFLRVISTASPR